MNERALGRFHLRTGVVESLAAPHNRTQGFLQGTAHFCLIEPREEKNTAACVM